MAITTTNLITLIRYFLNDTARTVTDAFSAKADAVFTLSEPNVVSVSDVRVNGVSSSVTYSYDSTTNKVTITSAISTGDAVEIDSSVYERYSDTDITNASYRAIGELALRNYKTFDIQSSTVYPEPSLEEKNLICAIAALILEPNNISYRLPDVSIRVPETEMPLDDKISKLIQKAKTNIGIFDGI